MGLFSKASEAGATMTPPSVLHTPVPTPPAGGYVTKYQVLGEWTRDGQVMVPNVLIIEMSDDRRTEKPGDVLELTREEAYILGRTFVLAPVVEAA